MKIMNNQAEIGRGEPSSSPLPLVFFEFLVGLWPRESSRAAQDQQAGLGCEVRGSGVELEEMQGTLLKGRWKIVKKIGQGAFGEIYSGADLTTQDPIAIKLERWDHKKVHPVHVQRAGSPFMYACALHLRHLVAPRVPLPDGGGGQWECKEGQGVRPMPCYSPCFCFPEPLLSAAAAPLLYFMMQV
jgi:hypothetical protein